MTVKFVSTVTRIGSRSDGTSLAQGLLLAALLVSTTHGKLLGKILGSGSGCGPSLQLPRFNLLSMLCRPSSSMSNWMGSGGYGGLGWSGMGSYNQYPGYGKASQLW